MDIYYRPYNKNKTVTVIKNGTEIFRNLFDPIYKRDSAKNFNTATSDNKTKFFDIMYFFINPNTVNTIDEDFLYAIRDKFMNSNPPGVNYMQQMGRFPWRTLKSLKFNIQNQASFINNIILPIRNYDIRLRDLKQLKERCNFDSVYNTTYEESLNITRRFLNELKKSGGILDSSVTMKILYDEYLINPEILKPICNLITAHSSNCKTYRHGFSGTSAGFPTIDRLIKTVITERDEERRLKLINTYINACRNQDVALFTADIDSNIPAAWQIAMKTKNTILNEMSFTDLKYVVDTLYRTVTFVDVTGTPKKEQVFGRSFKWKIRNKTTEEFINVVNSHFKLCTNEELSMQTLLNKLDELKEEIKSGNSRQYRPQDTIQKLEACLKIHGEVQV